MEAGVSTHLFVYERLGEQHLAMVADAGFGIIELWGAKPHFDYSDAAEVDRLEKLLSRHNLAVDSVHAPLYTEMANFKVSRWLNLGSPDAAERISRVSWSTSRPTPPSLDIYLR